MAYGFTGKITAAIVGEITKANDITAVAADVNKRFELDIAPGTGTGKADILFSDTRTISASSSENLDLAGVLSDVFGSTITAVKVKAVMVKAASGNTNDVLVGGAASNTFTGWFGDATDIVGLKPGECFVVTNTSGWTVTASTGDILKVANSSSGSTVDYDIVILAASA